MKKALLLGIMAFFALNIATIENVNAQDNDTPVTNTSKKDKDDKKVTPTNNATTNFNQGKLDEEKKEKLEAEKLDAEKLEEMNKKAQDAIHPDPKKNDDLMAPTQTTGGDRSTQPKPAGKNDTKDPNAGKLKSAKAAPIK